MLWLVSCAVGQSPDSTTTSSSSGSGGGDFGPCGVDCSKFETPQCMVAVCNTGQEVGPLNTCVVVPAAKGKPCDDGLFCTVDDACDNGTCSGGKPNTCGIGQNPCISVICYEDSKSCDTTPVNDGAECTPKDLCQVNGTCHIGECLGEPKDCTFSPLHECNTVACDPTSGKCVGTPDTKKDDAPCVLTGPLCSVNKTCKAGACGGGAPKDCSAFNVGCEVGVCDDVNGFCGPAPAPIGTTCSEGISDCHVGKCDVKGTCIPDAAPDGTACNDHNACTKSDSCAGGACTGSAVAGCSLYLSEGFESCNNGWTLAGDWQCGKPANVGPSSANTGTNVLATQIAAYYTVNQTFAGTTADSPPINLAGGTNPTLSFWAWDYTEGGTFDGWNLKVSTDNGQTFTTVTTVTPAYPLMITSQPAWGGNHSTAGWQRYMADLTAFAGQTIILRYAFRSDGATVYPGVYIDDVVVAEPLQTPLFISTTSPLKDVYEGQLYTVQFTKTGGTPAAVWEKVPGGTNADWITIDSSGLLKNTPPPGSVGPVTFTVRVKEPALPSNFAEKTFTFNVNQAAYYTSFEETCPGGWTLTGDWECGVPTNVGPATAYVGQQCIATQIAGPYHDLQNWGTATATSPDINLAGLPNPTLTFRMWIDTEGSTYDGANLSISTDGGVNYNVITNITPAYPLTVAGKPAWGGHQSAVGWQLVQADLSAYIGQTIRLQFSFRSDSSGNYPGVYIDDILVN
ncbi:bacillopeptidase F [Minicystis rosea]|nr:bacillopeptidase F [Minicystis rosea]